MFNTGVPTMGSRKSRSRYAIGRVFAAFDSFSAARGAAREAERLMMMSDDALTRRGLRREDVMHHAFRSYFGT